MSYLRFLNEETLIVIGAHPEYHRSMERRLTIRRSQIAYLISDFFTDPNSRSFEELILVMNDSTRHHARLTRNEIVAVEAWWIGLGRCRPNGEYVHDYKPITSESEKNR